MRTGLPPRVAKRMLTYREFLEFSRYCAKQPIDDQSNHHFPMAMLGALYKAHHLAKDSESPKLTDFLVFWKEPEPSEPQDVDEQLRHLAFMFKT